MKLDTPSGAQPACSLPVSVSVQLVPDDLYRMTVSYFTRKLWMLWIFPTLALVGLPLILVSHGPQRDKTIANFEPACIGAAIALVILFVFPYFSARSSFKSHPALQQETLYTFSDDGISVQSPTASSRTDWSNITQATETRNYLYLFLSKNIRWIIPKRSFSDTASLSALREILKSHIKGKVRLRT
jgi:YcxB-like protein